jgi:hypothetical protein
MSPFALMYVLQNENPVQILRWMRQRRKKLFVTACFMSSTSGLCFEMYEILRNLYIVTPSQIPLFNLVVVYLMTHRYNLIGKST